MDSSPLPNCRLGSYRADAGGVPGEHLSISASGNSSRAAARSFAAFANAGRFHFVGILAYSTRP